MNCCDHESKSIYWQNRYDEKVRELHRAMDQRRIAQEREAVARRMVEALADPYACTGLLVLSVRTMDGETCDIRIGGSHSAIKAALELLQKMEGVRDETDR